MPEPKNKQIRLRSRPDVEISPDNFEFGIAPAPDLTSADLASGTFVVRNRYYSLDPAMRGWIGPQRTYAPPVELGSVMRAVTAGEVVASAHPDFPVGTPVSGWLGLQQFSISDGEGVRRAPTGFPLNVVLGPLGITGLTAYFGLFDVGQIKSGETVVVSTAAGAVGSVCIQLARGAGCRVVGIAGGEEKCSWVTSIGADACIDYKADNVAQRLKELCPNGVDVYFDNVGGDILEAVLRRLNPFARIALCGAISQYNISEPRGPRNFASVLVNRVRMQGFVVTDYESRYDEGQQVLAESIRAGALQYKEHIVDGLEAAPATLMKLFDGTNAGKLIIRDADEY